ncbi:hypothetical protein [Rhodomicrobium sp.]|uniref:hypothetical protein n=1 Tax=Rhodomicrobium sp. TaxID=2720632 RepID=UPI0039E3A64E
MGRAKAAARNFTVDMWWTGLNDVEVGLFVHSRHRAKSRQFTADSDVIGEVLEGGERAGLITYREGLWKSEEPGAKRVVLKLFTPSMTWRGSIDLLVGRSVQLSTGARGFPVTSWSLNIDGHDQIVQVERSARKWPGLPEEFSFFLIEGGEARFYRLRQDWINFGGDYTLYDQTGARIGHLNGHVFHMAGRWDVTLDGAPSTLLATTLQLICGMLKFNGAARRHVGRVVRGVRQGAISLAIDKQEADLYLNPRRPR